MPAFANPLTDPASKKSSPLDLRIEQLPSVLSGTENYEDYFAPAFLAAVPAEQLKQLSVQFISLHGQPIRVVDVQPKGSNSATIRIEFEKAIATADISVESSAPNKVVGLLVKGFERTGDTFAKIEQDFSALPGKAGYLVEKAGTDNKGQQIAGRNVTQQFAIASTFKLYILAELASQIQAGRRSWSDVVPIIERSYSSTGTQNWPRNTPVTLQTLATWMISLSDNSATDALMRVLGRNAVEEKLASIGHGDPDKALPLLTTVEAFALKSNPVLRNRFQNSSELQQREILEQNATSLSFEAINLVELGSGPVAVESVEWFASPADIANLVNNIRSTGNPTALEVMGVNKGIAPTAAAKWKYLGYKGGSEPGVISMTILAQSAKGDWYTITGSWNNPSALVDNDVFAALMTRLVDTVNLTS
ncbi:MAG: serine hydrolase [Sphingorhabdus sp.]